MPIAVNGCRSASWYNGRVTSSPAMRRDLGFWDTTAVVIGAIIGVGIFFTPGSVARTAGSVPVAMGLWALGGVIAALGALTFAELGRRYPRAGGQYDVLRDGFGALPGFLYVFCNLTAIQTGTVAIIACICVDNLALAAGIAIGDWPRLAGALVLIAGLAGANAIGVRRGAWVQNFTVVAKLVTLGAIVLLAVVAGDAPRWPDTPSGSQGIAVLAGLLPCLFSYGGWQQALWVGGEVRDGERTLPRAILFGVGVVIVVYLAAVWAYFELLGYWGVIGADALAADAVGAIFPGPGARIVAAAVGLSAFGVLNAQFLTGPRLVWALAADGQFFSAFARIHPRFATPVPAILLLAGLAAVLLLLAGPDGADRLTAWVVVVDALFFALTGLCLVRIFRREGRTLAIVVPLLFAALELAAVVGAVVSPYVRAAALTGFAWIAVAVVIWVIRFRRPARA